jgi:hypothetical protein
MDIRKKVLVAIFLLSVSMLTAVPLGTHLALAFRSPLFPTDPEMGQMVLKNIGPVETLTDQALRETWSPDWVERYVERDNQYGFTKSFDALMASLLPQETFSMSQAKENGNLTSIIVRLGEPGSLSVSYITLTWEVDENQNYHLVAISRAS